MLFCCVDLFPVCIYDWIEISTRIHFDFGFWQINLDSWMLQDFISSTVHTFFIKLSLQYLPFNNMHEGKRRTRNSKHGMNQYLNLKITWPDNASWSKSCHQLIVALNLYQTVILSNLFIFQSAAQGAHISRRSSWQDRGYEEREQEPCR